MSASCQPAVDMAALWNGSAARAWIDAQETLDQMFRPIEELMVAAVRGAGALPRVLDVGCGTGATTLAMARAAGCAVGVDISAPMIDVARARAEREHSNATFICADAQGYAFEPANFDLIVSRFGLMFFEDPVAAFVNLQRAARRDGELCSFAWRSPAENPFMTTAERAAAPFLPALPPRRPDAPGQFAFADPQRVRGILEQSGWQQIDIQPVDIECTFSAADLQRYVTRLGPVGMVLQQADDDTRTKVVDTLRAAFAPFVHGAEVRFTAACWVARARAGSADASDRLAKVRDI